ncbi:MAG: amidohydrolase [Tissierellia bacterium]|nr:amidohydrolase [Tissierellia bacterium]
MENLLDQIKEIVKEKQPIFEDIANFLWQNPETGLVEYKSSKKIIEVMRENGFEVEESVDDIETAFIASKGSGKPIIGISCEYDALPGLSQDSEKTEKCAIEGQNAGHGCGHNLLGSGAVGAALVVAEYLDRNNLEGTVKLLGTPSEERDACKAFMGRDGYFDDLDFALTWHPESFNGIWDGGSLANTIAVYNFKGRSAHAAAAPHLGRSALDSAELMNVGVNYLREHVVDDARIHYSYLDVGGRAPNVVQSTASVYYFIRSAKIEDSTEIYERINNIAKGAAMMMGTTVDIDLKVAIADYLPNLTLSQVLYESIQEFGLPDFDNEDFELAKKFYDSLEEGTKNSGKNRMYKHFEKEEADEMIEKRLATGLNKFTGDYGEGQVISSDVGELSHYTPTAQMFLAAAAIGTPLHSWQMTAQANTSIGKKALYSAVGALALTAVKVLHSPEIIEKAKKELHDAIGDYKSPIPKDVKLRDPKVEQ